MYRFIVLLLCWGAVFSAKAENISQPRHSLAVVDAGSTGSRLHIYAYDLDENNNPTQIIEQWSNHIQPGLATLKPNKATIEDYLSILFKGAPPQPRPIFFYATGGMRMLPESKQQLFYKTIRTWFSSQSNWQLMDVKTITGREEGILGWIAVNYQKGAFTAVEKPLVSVMDMGGASVQLTFPLQSMENIDPDDVFDVLVSGRHFLLFSHSFLGLGQMVFSEQFKNESSCFSIDYPLPNGLLGKGDGLTCHHAVSKIISTVHKVHDIVEPAIHQNRANLWYAMGGVASLAEDKPLSFQNNQFTNQGLLERANTESCQRPWLDLLAENPGNDYLYGGCFFSAYYYALMVDGYGLQPEQPINYLSKAQVFDWSLGVVLHQQLS